MSKISIIGTGTWGIALANLLSKNGHEIIAWSALEEEIDYIEKYRKHPKLKETYILKEINLTKKLECAIKESEIIVMAVPSIFVRDTARKISQFIKQNQIVVDVAKGIESHTLLTMSEIIYEEINKVIPFEYGHIVALSGPTHAEEVSIGLPSTIVSASVDRKTAKKIQKVFTSQFMRVYTNDDIKGVEICGSLKNIIALGAGISHGLGYGDNATAALVTRGISEMSRLGIAMGCPIHTFYGLAGLGDLVVTCTSLHSRNNQCGMYIGQGLSVNEAVQKVGMVVEGINALDAAYALSEKYQVELPIINGVYQIVKKSANPSETVKQLFNRESKAEIPFSALELLHQDLKGHSKKVMLYGQFFSFDYKDIEWIKLAKQYGDYMIVCLEKGNLNFDRIKILLESIRDIDYVVGIDHQEMIAKYCKQYHIDVFVIGDDWKGKFDFLQEDGVEVVYLPRTPEISTTRIKEDLHD